MLVAWLPAGARTNEILEIAGPDVEVEIGLDSISA